MGAFYANIALQTTDQPGVIQLLGDLSLSAYVLPPTKGFTIVCEERCDTQDTAFMSSLAEQLSLHFDCAALAVVNHDDGLLWYVLYASGSRLDVYDSAPDYFACTSQDGPALGNARILCEVFGKPRSFARIDRILHTTGSDEEYLSAGDRHVALARALGLPAEYVQVGYEYLRGEDETTDDKYGKVKAVSRAWLRRVLGLDEIRKPFDLRREVRNLVRKNRRISAMVLYQQHTGCSLKEARQYIDSL